MPYFCLEKITRALNSAETLAPGQQRPPRRRLLQGGRRRPARVAGPEAGRAAAGRGRRGLLHRPARPGRCPSTGSSRRRSTAPLESADCVAIVTAHSGIDYGRARRARSPRGRLPQRDGRERQPRTARSGSCRPDGRSAGLGALGVEPRRNFSELAEGSTWICDANEARLARQLALPGDPSHDELRRPARGRRRSRRSSSRLPCRRTPSSRRTSARTREARLRREADGAARSRRPRTSSGSPRSAGSSLMPGHLLLYHPGVAKLKELVDSGELGDVLYVYGNRQNLGTIRRDENALWSLGAHDLSVILHLVGEEPSELWARGESFLKDGVEDVVFCYLALPVGQGRAHAPLLARPAQDAADDRGRVGTGWPCSTTWSSTARSPSTTGPRSRLGTYGEWRTRTGTSTVPGSRTTSRSASSARTSSRSSAARATAAAARAGLGVVRASSSSRPRSSESA